MTPTVHDQIETDVRLVYEKLTGKPQDWVAGSIVGDAYFDISDGKVESRGSLVDAICNSDNPIYLGRWMRLLGCSFHLSAVLFDSEWHEDFDLEVEMYLDGELLPFVYNPDFRMNEITPEQLKMWAVREMAGPCREVIEAYKYGNGFPVLKANGFLNRWYDRCSNLTLSSWLYWRERWPSPSSS